MSSARLSEDAIEEFDRRGYLLLPDLLDDRQTGLMREEIARLREIEAPCVYLTEEGCTIYGFHDAASPVGSRLFDELSRSGPFLDIARQLLGDDQLYVYNSKMNCKNSLVGAPMHWHQDYEYWYRDGVKSPDMLTFLILPERVDVHDGCLYIMPGSHKLGPVRHRRVMVGSHKQVAVNPDAMKQAFDQADNPVPLVGPAGTVAVFHANTIHGSSNNLGIRDRWQIYLSYNRCNNAPSIRKYSRPDFIVSRNTQAL